MKATLRRSIWTKGLALAALLGESVLPLGSARAQHDERVEAPASPEPEANGSAEARRDAARRAFQAGTESYKTGHFEEALRFFRKAYELAEGRARLLLLLNIAQTLDRLDREEEALEHYEWYLQRMPEGPKAGVARGRVEVLRRRIAAREAERRAQRERMLRLLAEAEARGKAQAARAHRAPLWPWLLAGGAAVAAGSVVAVLLLSGGDSKPLPVELPPVDFRVEALR